MKRTLTYLFILANLSLARLVGAQDYTLLEPSVLLNNQSAFSSGNNKDLLTYLKFIFSSILVMATVLSVLMIVIAGVEYIASSIPGAKSDAKNRIKNALFGLFIALFSWLLLNTIDPSLTNLQIDATVTSPQQTN